MTDDKLTADDLYRSIMEVWERQTKRELGDKSQHVPQPDLSGNRTDEQGAV